ncbi:response regulator transcription factor [Paenibacillus apiarius]|uniref:response regulator transcription factor n=1 Tax=Paenibacillus apiarius TaxID=46240 RepID=UPI001981C7F3|nr:response regulator [Paenibacillus apiarius]MBN3525161.1 response regulator [Paenibacillus apiarius]
MRVLIVDDEPLVRIGLKSAIRWEAAGLEIAGEAADGEEAIKLILERQPDVVMLDIKMPKKDGLEVLQEMKALHVPAKVIILSSFDDFNLVKKAMKLGAADYFHKPSMNVQEIEAVLAKLKEEAESGSEGAPSQSGGSVRGKEDVVRHLLRGSMDGVRQTKLQEGNLYALLFTIKNYTHVAKRYTKDNASILPNTIGNIVSELLSKEPEAEYVQLEDNLYAVLVSHSGTKSVQASFAHVNELVYLISAALKRFVNIDTVFGISGPAQVYQECGQAAMQARQALARKFYHPNDPIFYAEAHRNGDAEQALEQVNAHIAAMKNGLKDEKYDEFARSLSAWEQFLQQSECMDEKDVRKIYQGLLFMLKDGEEYWGDANRLEEIEDFSELSVVYHSLFNERLAEKLAQQHKEYSPLIRGILQYIDTNYREDISLKSLGEQFHVSPNYISRLFKQEVNRGLFDYLNEVRIEKAKELLLDYRYKIYEVADMTGFNSQVHFAIVFHKYVGMSPKEYRKETV